MLLSAGTETEVQTGLSAMRKQVTGWTSELYQYLFEHSYIVVSILLVILLILLIRHLKISFSAHRARKKKIESTNTWFDWAEFHSYEKERENQK